MNLRGISKHQSFGLRKEWLELWLSYPTTWEEVGDLGPRQVEAFRVWLKTAGLTDKKGRPTELAEAFRDRGLTDLELWEKLWVNVVFNFATARWYVLKMGCGSWSVGKLLEKFQEDHAHYRKRTLQNALQELVGFLERTPVGEKLAQGKVVRMKRGRVVTREGLSCPSPSAVKLALERLKTEEKRDSFGLNEKILFPWVVFGVEAKILYRNLISRGIPPFSLEEDRLTLERS